MMPGSWPVPVGRGELILVVDDDEAIRAVVADILTLDGYRTVLAADGVAALALAAERHPDLIVLDGLMPGMNGWEVYDALVAHGEPPPIIFLSAVADFATRMGTLRVGAADFLVKPVSMEELLARVAVALRSARKEES